jgi:hypothetical protein
MRELTMNEVQDVNGAGWGDFLLGLAVNGAYDAITGGGAALWNMRNNDAGSLGEFYNLHF